LKLSVPIVATLPRFLLGLRRASQLIAGLVLQTIERKDQKMHKTTHVLTANKYGHDEETTGKKGKKKSQQVFSKGSKPNSSRCLGNTPQRALLRFELF